LQQRPVIKTLFPLFLLCALYYTYVLHENLIHALFY